MKIIISKIIKATAVFSVAYVLFILPADVSAAVLFDGGIGALNRNSTTGQLFKEEANVWSAWQGLPIGKVGGYVGAQTGVPCDMTVRFEWWKEGQTHHYLYDTVTVTATSTPTYTEVDFEGVYSIDDGAGDFQIDIVPTDGCGATSNRLVFYKDVSSGDNIGLWRYGVAPNFYDEYDTSVIIYTVDAAITEVVGGFPSYTDFVTATGWPDDVTPSDAARPDWAYQIRTDAEDELESCDLDLTLDGETFASYHAENSTLYNDNNYGCFLNAADAVGELPDYINGVYNYTVTVDFGVSFDTATGAFDVGTTVFDVALDNDCSLEIDLTKKIVCYAKNVFGGLFIPDQHAIGPFIDSFWRYANIFPLNWVSPMVTSFVEVYEDGAFDFGEPDGGNPLQGDLPNVAWLIQQLHLFWEGWAEAGFAFAVWFSVLASIYVSGARMLSVDVDLDVVINPDD